MRNEWRALLLCLALFASDAALADGLFLGMGGVDPCRPRRCPNGVKETSVCFVDPDLAESSDPRSRSASVGNCPVFGRQFVIRDVSDFDRAFGQVLDSCQRIKSLTFMGHGSPNYHGAGRLDRDGVGYLSRFKCAMADDVDVSVKGCNIGRGCLGQVFMGKFADALIPKRGTVVAPTHYGVTFLVSPIFSINGTWRKLAFDRSKQPKENWSLLRWLPSPLSLTAQIPVPDQNPVQSCVAEASRELDLYRRAAARAPQCGPAVPASVISDLESQLTQLRSTPRSRQTTEAVVETLPLPYGDDFVWTSFWLTNARAAIDDCRRNPPKASTRGGTKAGTSTR